ncbi:MAG: efflux RND transporter periplasmic adaptor subunit [Spirochaetia bacterium]|nr:efflux RND transporter periplasmic adaptor subunit [Spirochaetia bacterium]
MGSTKPRKKILVALLIGGGALVISLVAWIALRPLSSQVKPKMGRVVEAVYGIGTVTARHTYQLKLGVIQTLTHIYHKEGESVKKGEALVSFADNPTVYAPFDGVLTSIPFKEGETVFPQLPIVTLSEMKNPYIVVSLEQSGALRVRIGQSVILSFESLRGQRVNGSVSAIYPKDGQFYVNIEVPEVPDAILEGMTADVAIQVASKENVLQIPLVAVNQGRVTVIRGGLPLKIAVKLGAVDGTWAEVLDNNIRIDDLVLVPGKK